MKDTATATLIAAIIIVGAIIYTNKDSGVGALSREDKGYQAEPEETVNKDNVTEENGNQIIKILAKGGYFPRITAAKADVPTVLRMETKSSFDCSIALVIPAIKYRANLKPTGVTDITIPPQKAGTVLNGVCAMGMYNFQVKFD